MKDSVIVFLHGLGDCVMFTGVLKSWHERTGRRARLILRNESCAQVFHNHPAVDGFQFIPFQPRYWHPVFTLGDQSAVKEMVRQLGHREFIHIRIQTLPELWYRMTNTYGGHKVLRMARELGVTMLQPAPYLVCSHEVDGQCADTVIHAYSRDRRKCMPKPVLDWLQDRYPPSDSVRYIAAGESGDLRELAGALRHARRVIATDSCVAHLAASVDVPLLFVYRQNGRPNWFTPVYTAATQCRLFSDVNELDACLT